MTLDCVTLGGAAEAGLFCLKLPRGLLRYEEKTLQRWDRLETRAITIQYQIDPKSEDFEVTGKRSDLLVKEEL